MSDEGTALGLAPRANLNLYGQEAAEQALLEAFHSGRLAHAWLLAGPRGIGKATLAYRFARFVLASGRAGGLFGASGSPASLALPPDHPVFRRVASGGHADLLSVERSVDERGRLRSEIVVEDARAIADFLHLTPAEGGWRVVVIDGAEEMNRSAANAVLKVIEEPPRQSLILMVSHAPGRLLATIRSRCRRLVLKPLESDAITRILAERRPGLAPDDMEVLAALAEGSAGRALALAEEGGLALFHEILELLAGLPGIDVVALHRLAGRATGSEGEVAYRAIGELLLWWLARLIRAGASGEAPAELVPGEGAVYRRLARPGNLDRWLEVWEKTRHLLSRAESLNLERKQVLLNALLALEGAAHP